MFRIKDRRKNGRNTVDQIVGSLMRIQEDLEALNEEKASHIARLETEKSSIEAQIQAASTEKERATRIFGNIKDLIE